MFLTNKDQQILQRYPTSLRIAALVLAVLQRFQILPLPACLAVGLLSFSLLRRAYHAVDDASLRALRSYRFATYVDSLFAISRCNAAFPCRTCYIGQTRELTYLV
jgi:hypothetical protein